MDRGSGDDRRESATSDEVARYAPLFDGDVDLTLLWIRLKHHGDDSARAELATLYVPLVRYVVSRMNITLPSGMERGDLVGFGTLGLFDAIDKFSLELELSFKTYGVTRIRGSILDQLRALDWVPRRMRSQLRTIEQAASSYAQEHGAEPEISDLATATGLEVREVRAAMAAYRRGYVTSLDEPGGDEDTRSDGRSVVDPAAELPDEVYDHEESRRIVRGHIRSLPLRDRAVIALYYFEELTFSEIGRVLEVSESRACQVHGRAVRALRAVAEGE